MVRSPCSSTYVSSSPTLRMIESLPTEAACTICFSIELLILLESCCDLVQQWSLHLGYSSVVCGDADANDANLPFSGTSPVPFAYPSAPPHASPVWSFRYSSSGIHLTSPSLWSIFLLLGPWLLMMLLLLFKQELRYYRLWNIFAWCGERDWLRALLPRHKVQKGVTCMSLLLRTKGASVNDITNHALPSVRPVRRQLWRSLDIIDLELSSIRNSVWLALLSLF